MSDLTLAVTIAVSVLGGLEGVELIRLHIAGLPRPGWTFIIPNSGTAEKVGDGPLRHVRHWTMRPLGGQEMYEVKAHVWGDGADLRTMKGHRPPRETRPVMRVGDDPIEMDVLIDESAPADVWVGITWTEHHGRVLMEHAQCHQVFPTGEASAVQVWKPYARWYMSLRRRLSRRATPPSGRWKHITMTRTADHGPESVMPQPPK